MKVRAFSVYCYDTALYTEHVKRTFALANGWQNKCCVRCQKTIISNVQKSYVTVLIALERTHLRTFEDNIQGLQSRACVCLGMGGGRWGKQDSRPHKVFKIVTDTDKRSLQPPQP